MIFFGFISCGQKKNVNRQIQIDEQALQLNDSAASLAVTFEHDKVLKAIELLDQATRIQPDYYLAYWNKMVFQSQIGRTEEAIETLNKLEEIKPKDPDLKTLLGVYIELNKDSLQARQKFMEAENLYSRIFDTLKIESDLYSFHLTNRAINFKLLGFEKDAEETFQSVKKEQTNQDLQEMILEFQNLDRKELLEYFRTRK